MSGLVKGSVGAGVTSAAKAIGKEAAKAALTAKGGDNAAPESCWSSWTKRQCSDTDAKKMQCTESKRIYEECKLSERVNDERQKRDKQGALMLSKP